jgi:hypothetical protein
MPALHDGVEPTPLQDVLIDFAELLARVRELDQRRREVFAAIARLRMQHELGPELLLAEAEEVLGQAA